MLFIKLILLVVLGFITSINGNKTLQLQNDTSVETNLRRVLVNTDGQYLCSNITSCCQRNENVILDESITTIGI